MVQQEGKCVICGKTFIKNCGVQKTCSKECSKELHDHTMALQKEFVLFAEKSTKAGEKILKLVLRCVQACIRVQTERKSMNTRTKK